MTTDAPAFELADHMRVALRHSAYNSIAMAKFLGVTPQTVSSWLNGKTLPSLPVLRLWASETGVPYEWLAAARAECAARDSNPEPADYWPVAA